MKQSFYSPLYLLHLEGQQGEPRNSKMATGWKRGFHEKRHRQMKDFMPNKKQAGVLGGGKSMGKKRRSLDEVVSPCYHIWTWVDRGSSSSSSVLWLKLFVLCLELLVP